MVISNDKPLLVFPRMWRGNHWELYRPHKSPPLPPESVIDNCCPVVQFFPRCYHRGWCPVVWIQPRLHLVGSNWKAQAGGEGLWVTTTSWNISEPLFSPISVSPLVCRGSTFNIGIYVSHWVTALIIDVDPEDKAFVIIWNTWCGKVQLGLKLFYISRNFNMTFLKERNGNVVKFLKCNFNYCTFLRCWKSHFRYYQSCYQK